MRSGKNWKPRPHEQPTNMLLSDSRGDFQIDSGGAIDMSYNKPFFEDQSGIDPQLTFSITDGAPVYFSRPMLTDFANSSYSNPASTEQATPSATRPSPSIMDRPESHQKDQPLEFSRPSNIVEFQNESEAFLDGLSSPTFHDQTQEVEHDDGTAEQNSDNESRNSSNRTEKRKRGRRASIKKQKSVPSERKDSLIGEDDDDDDDEGEYDEHNKREKFLERNRVAASKCRRKKKEWTEHLESQLKTLAAERSQLRASKSILRNNLLDLKDLLIQHVDCDCVGIRQYLNQLVAQKTPYAPVYQLAEQATQRHDDHCPHGYTEPSNDIEPALDMPQYQFDSPMFSPTDGQHNHFMPQTHKPN